VRSRESAGEELKDGSVEAILRCCTFSTMSMTEILEELPRLSHEERRELTRQLIALEPEHEDLAMCDEAARAGFAMLDEMERKDEAGA
jgi:lipid A disaccharide synthetase